MTRVTLSGHELQGFDRGLPAASVRLLLPEPESGIVMPFWNGNEFLLDDGSRPTIRTLTPVRFDEQNLELDLDVVKHDAGPLSTWADHVAVGDAVAVSGTGRGYEVDPDARCFLIAGDESALPAIGVLMRELSPEAELSVLIEVRSDAARLELPRRAGSAVQWLVANQQAPPGDGLVVAVEVLELAEDVRIWAAGEAAAMQRIRRNLFEERTIPRGNAVVRGYWKLAR